MWKSVGNGTLEGITNVPDIDPSKLVINLSDELKPIPPPETLVFGQVKTDHMLTVTFDPVTGWSAPEIKPYGPLSLDPSSSCFQYATNVFEGMKAYIGSDGEPRLFRPDLNMARMARSVDRVALPPFNPEALLTLIKKLVHIERRWIPTKPGYSLYIRPTMIALGVTASDHAMLYIILSPTGPYFQGIAKEFALLAVSESVRAWPGGHGAYKLAVNYGPGFQPLREAVQKGYSQVLWLLGDRVMEAGAMNFFAAVKRDDGDLDLITPSLDGTILPGVTRQSVIELANAHTQGKSALPGISPSQKLHIHERDLTMTELKTWYAEGKLVETFGVGTAAIVCSVTRIGHEGQDLVLSKDPGSTSPVAQAFFDRISDIQTGKFEFEKWSPGEKTQEKVVRAQSPTRPREKLHDLASLSATITTTPSLTSMLASRPISRNGENAIHQKMPIAKTPGRGLQNENALRNLQGTVGRGKSNILQTPFQPKSIKAGPKDVQTGPSKVPAIQLHTISRPFLDKTPFPNRIITLQEQTPFARDLSETPDSAQRPSSTRKHIRLPRHSQKFETPLNTKPHWDISEDDFELAVPMEVPPVVEEKEDYDEVEYMAPNTLDLPYQPPLDFELPDYKEVGRSILEARKWMMEEPQTPPDIVPDMKDIGFVSWDMLPLPELEDDDPFRIARAELQKEKRMVAPKPAPRSTAAPVRTVSKPVPVPAVTRARPITTIATRASRPGTSASTAPPTTHARTAPAVSRPPVVTAKSKNAASATTARQKATTTTATGARVPTATSQSRGVTAGAQRKLPATGAAVKASATTSRVASAKAPAASMKRPATSASHHKPMGSSRTATTRPGSSKAPAVHAKEKTEEDLIFKVDVVKADDDDFLFDV
ncbi:branched-chain-amino-acid transaminase bat2 [Paramarasmius palmivorus]|uniref:Branched-chain-amino-acid aminotransferase n=1 Tax=Paramarasmius palmivorus TaxID=297713 RepID=A0AAW0CTE5_9AGAR